MLNQFVLVGRIETVEENALTINVTRNYKNKNGVYESDKIKTIASINILEELKEYCKKGDLVGVKGKIESNENTIILKAEKITFLSTRKEKEEN